MKKIIILFTLCLSFSYIIQAQDNLPIKDRDFMATEVFDREGNSYSIEDLRFSTKKTRAISPTCTAGIFRLHFDDAGTNTGFDDPTTGQQRANMTCQVFTDLSQLISEAQSPYTSIPNLGTTNFVEIQVRASLNNASNSMLGNAGQYFMTTSPGIVHGTIWQTINTGIDAWFGINNTNFGNQGIYHGQVQINFGHNFYTGTNAAGIGTNQIDLYSVMLHEALHALGIGSLIDQNGNSKLTNSNPGIYSNYDLQLKANNTSLINWNGCYNAQFVGSIPQLTTPCTITYSSNNSLFVSSDANWSNGTSLSHFPMACGNTGNLVLHPSMSAGVTKRFPDPQEVSALCALGYETSGIYPGTTLPNFTQCGGIIAGTNDYALYTPSAPGANYSFPANSPVTLNSNDFLGNDNNATYFSCLEVVNNSGTITGGNSGSLNTSVTFTPANNFAGTAILKYIPMLTPNTLSGNITYIFIDIAPPPLPPCAATNPCEMICYGGFEEFTSQAQYDDYTYGGYTTSNYPSFAYYPAQYPDNSPDFRQIQMQWPSHVNCGGSSTINAHTGISYIGMILRNNPSNSMNNPEGPALPLNGSVAPGESVTIKLWARVGHPNCNGGVEARLINMPPCMGNGGVLLANCAGLIQSVVDSSGPVSGSAYQQVTMSITNTTTVPMTHLLINSLPYSTYISQPFGFVFIDDVSVIKNVPELTITKSGPNAACPGDTISYNITVTNNSLSPAFNVVVEDSLSNGLGYVTGGSFNYPTQTINNLAPNATVNYTINAVVNSTTGTETNTVKVISGACLSDSSIYSVTTDISSPTLKLNSSINKTAPCKGETVILSVEVCNYEQDSVNNISIQSFLPTGYIPMAGAGYTISGNTITWNNFYLTPGTITTPSCTTLTCNVTLGTQNNQLCQSVISGGSTCVKGDDCLNINFDNCWPESVDNFNGIKFFMNCYPNPSKGIVYFEGYISEVATLTIYNAVGQIVKTRKLPKGDYKIEENIASVGIYKYSLSTIETKLKSGKFIIR